MNTPKELKYTESDEWVLVEGEVATIGLTDFAQDQLSDLVYFEALVEVGETVEHEANLATVESVKSTGDVLSPISGEIVEINPALDDEPDTVNTDPYVEGWMFKIKIANPEELNDLLSDTEYLDQIEE